MKQESLPVYDQKQVCAALKLHPPHLQLDAFLSSLMDMGEDTLLTHSQDIELESIEDMARLLNKQDTITPTEQVALDLHAGILMQNLSETKLQDMANTIKTSIALRNNDALRQRLFVITIAIGELTIINARGSYAGRIISLMETRLFSTSDIPDFIDRLIQEHFPVGQVQYTLDALPKEAPSLNKLCAPELSRLLEELSENHE